MDRIDEWRLFVTVARLRSFAGAARQLERSPQAVTRAVAALETRLGTRLLNRTTRSVSLTYDGERYLERGRQALQSFDQLESGNARAPLSGRLTVTAPVLFGQLHVLPVVSEFLGRHPELDLKLLLLDRVVSLAEEGVDVAVRLGPLPDSALRARQIGRVRAVVCASPAYLARAGVPRRPEDLSRHSCVAFTGTSPIVDRWSFTHAGWRERAVAVRARLVVNSGQAAIDAALAGLGVVRVLSYQVARLVAARKLRILLAAYEGRAVPVQLVHLPGVQTPASAAFLEFAAGRLRRRL
jgi:DNA-binding transcriptional LysR family regulator